MIDISMKLEKNHEVWKWLESQNNKLISTGHIGTHIDVYNKSEIPEIYIKTKGILIDCTSYNLDDEIGIETLKNKNIEKGDFVIFKTNIQEKYPYGSEVYIKSHNQLSWELINYLTYKEVSFIGIDCAGIRRGKEHFEADIKCEENNTYIIENLDLRNLTNDNSKKFLIYTIWIDNPLSTGLATRVFVDYIGRD